MLTINGIDFVTAGAWQTLDEGHSKKKIREFIEERDDADLIRGYVVIGAKHEDHSDTIGLFETDTGNSLAATIASSDVESGFYVLRLDEDPERPYWLAIIDNGDVMAGSGVTGGLEYIQGMVAHGQNTAYMDLPIFVTDPEVASEFPSGQHVDLEEIIDEDAVVPIKPIKGKASGRTAVLAGVAVAVMAAMGGTYFYLDSGTSAPVVSDAEKEAAEQREAFIQGQNQAMSRILPTSNEWAFEAIREIGSTYAINGMGWVFDGGMCDPTGCDLVWRGKGDSKPYEPFLEYVGIDPDTASLNTTQEGTITARIPIENEGFEEFDQARIGELERSSKFTNRWWEAKQVHMLRMPSVEIELPGAMSQAQPGTIPPNVNVGMKGSTDIRGKGEMDLRYMIKAMENMPAKVTQLTYAPGTSELTQNAWKIEVSYVAQK